jgi:predicted transcriptional regulator
VQRGEKVLTVGVRHDAEIDLDVFNAVYHHQAVADVGHDPVLQRATGRREGDADGDLSALDVDVSDHV